MSATDALRAAATGETKNPVAQFRDFLEKQKAQLVAALPRHISPDRMIRLACTELAKNPLLQKCTPVSVFGSIIQSSQLGLEIGVLGQAYLVPYRNNKNNTYEAQFIPGYKGLIALARRSGEVTSIETNIVYERDTFDLSLGLDTHLKHVPFLDGERGVPRLVYGVAKFRDGGHHFEWMTISEVNKIRARSKSRDNGPWVTDYEQMVRKSLIRRMANYLPMSIELQNALQIDDAVADGKHATLDGDFVVITDTSGDDTKNGAQHQIEQKQPTVEIPPAPTARETEPATRRASPTQDARPAQQQATEHPGTSEESVGASLERAQALDVLDVAADLISAVEDPEAQERLIALYRQCRQALGEPARGKRRERAATSLE